MRMLLAAAIIAASALPATAAAVCAPRDAIVKVLSDMGENHAGFGVTEKGALFELFVSGKDAGWTLVLSLPAGVSCIVATGTA